MGARVGRGGVGGVGGACVCEGVSDEPLCLGLGAPPVDNGATISLDKKREREVPRALILDLPPLHFCLRVHAHT
eukprot:COSAG06_NODE_7224_length_2581_cov_1.892425_3_plen_74_part_00